VDSCLTWQFSAPKNETRADPAVSGAAAVAVAAGLPPTARLAGRDRGEFPDSHWRFHAWYLLLRYVSGQGRWVRERATGFPRRDFPVITAL
jgi:hypothetical protein